MATVLLVEDDETLSETLKKELETAGFTVDTAMDGEEALKALRVSKPDVMLLDILLPKRSGFDILN